MKLQNSITGSCYL